MKPKQLEDLYGRYAQELYLYAYSLCQNRSMAQDLVSDTFYRALLSLEGTDLGWRSWLYRVCRNLWMDYLRRQRHIAPHALALSPLTQYDGQQTGLPYGLRLHLVCSITKNRHALMSPQSHIPTVGPIIC